MEYGKVSLGAAWNELDHWLSTLAEYLNNLGSFQNHSAWMPAQERFIESGVGLDISSF